MTRERITDPHITSIDLRGAMPGSHIVIVGCDSLERLWLPECAAGLRVELYLRDQVQELLVHGDVSELRGGLRRRFRTRLDHYPNPSGDGVFVRATLIRMSLEFLERPGVAALPVLSVFAVMSLVLLVLAFSVGDSSSSKPLRTLLLVVAAVLAPVRGGGLSVVPVLFDGCSDND
jgi:hypothetical protein